MVTAVRRSFVLLLPLLVAAAIPSTTWGQDAAGSLVEELFEGLEPANPVEPVSDTNPDLTADPEEVFTDAAVDTTVDSPVDTLFDASLDTNSSGSPESHSSGGASGPRASAPPTDAGKGIFQRRRLTGDWGGRRTALQHNGIRYRGRVTQYFMGVEGGIQLPGAPQPFAQGDTFAYTGNSRHDLLVDLDKFGGPEHGKFLVTLEDIWGRYGNVSFRTGAIAPAVFNAVQPVDPAASGSLYLTNFAIAQPLSKNLILSVGKSRLVAIADRNVLAGGDGSDQFLNQTFCMNPLYVPQLPFSTFAVGAVSPQEWGTFGVTLIDPQERTTEFMDLGSLFSTGAIIMGQVRFNTKFFDLPGQQHVGGFYKHADMLNVQFVPVPPTYPYPPADGTPQFQTLPSSYTISYGFDQYVTTYGPPTRLGHSPGWGVFGRAGISDGATGNPAFSAWHVSLGIGGESPLRTRRDKGDRFGIGYGYTAVSTEFGPIPRAQLDPHDVQAFESYYSWQATPAIAVSPDFQWIRGSLTRLTNNHDAYVFGIRMNMRL